MSAEFFLDTNLFVYSFDERFPDKQERSQDLIATALETRRGVISWQVVQEFINVARHKFEAPLSLDELNEYIDRVLEPLCVVHSSASLYRKALGVQLETQYRFYDSLIVAAALEAGCQQLYSEDLQSGRSINSLQVVDPYAA